MPKTTPTSDLSTPAATALGAMAEKTSELAHEMVERARQTSLTVREQAGRAGDRALTYVHDEPVKAVLISVAAGAALSALAGWWLRSRG
jgi:ElaB/YqjD/DUF883 family membrane-anchored ribosome-binding protein